MGLSWVPEQGLIIVSTLAFLLSAWKTQSRLFHQQPLQAVFFFILPWRKQLRLRLGSLPKSHSKTGTLHSCHLRGWGGWGQGRQDQKELPDSPPHTHTQDHGSRESRHPALSLWGSFPSGLLEALSTPPTPCLPACLTFWLLNHNEVGVIKITPEVSSAPVRPLRYFGGGGKLLHLWGQDSKVPSFWQEEMT